MTAPRKEYAPATKARSADCLLSVSLAKVPSMFRSGASLTQVEDHILIAALLADELYAEAGAA